MVVRNGKEQANGNPRVPVAAPFDQNDAELMVKELEMLPKLEEIQRLDTLIVGGTTKISEDVIGAIANQAAAEVKGVAQVGVSSLKRVLAERVGGAERRARGVDVEAGSKEAILDISIRLNYGYQVPNTVILIRQNVAKRLLSLCGLVAKEINIRVTGLEFPERPSGRVQ